MSLDEMNLDSDGGIGSSPEVSREKSEKQREASKKAQSQLQKTQKDEKKAQSDDDELFQLLTRFIQNPIYEDLIPVIVSLLQNSFPSRFILGCLSLVYAEGSFHIFKKIEKSIPTETFTSMYRYPERHEFHNDDIHESIREWVSLWMTSFQTFLIQKNVSVVLTQKLSFLLGQEENKVAKRAISSIFRFFFDERNISISANKSDAYADFILSQIETSLNKYLESLDEDLKSFSQVDSNNLFGL